MGRPSESQRNAGLPGLGFGTFAQNFRRFFVFAQSEKSRLAQMVIAGPFGEANLRDNRVSIVGMGRGAIAYPDFARDVTMDKRKVCITVSYCTTLMRAKGNELGQYAAGCAPPASPG